MHKKKIIKAGRSLKETTKALVMIHGRGATAEDGEYLTEWKPFHLSTSVTVFAELKGRRQRYGRGKLGLVAFGDPVYPKDEKEHPIADFAVRSLVERGFDFSPLPAGAFEVNSIARLYSGSAQVYLGREATEERVRLVSGGFRIIHFATHGIFDERSPLDSAIVLSIPAQQRLGLDNGLLQAWEIFDDLRLDADLVVLSACESGLGGEFRSEGLIGITRAFQYAGARSVLASMWKVADRTTAVLMISFYRNLKAGLPKDEALRRAQVRLMRTPIDIELEDGRHVSLIPSSPFYWAAFQVFGDWN